MPARGHSAKNLKKKSNFAECRPEDTRQRIFLKKIQTLLSAGQGHSAKNFFLKKIKNLCRVPAGLALGKETINGAGAVTVAFLCRVPRGSRQSLCRVPDKKHSAKTALPINFLPCVLCRVPHSAKALPSTIWPLPSASGTLPKK